MINNSENARLIWDIAELLRGDYKQSEYGKVILPMTVLRRLDCVLTPTKQKVLDFLPKAKDMKLKNMDPILNAKSGFSFHNRSIFDFEKLLKDPDHLDANLKTYINGFSAEARDIIDYFNFSEQIQKLDKANLLFLVVKRFSEVDLHPGKVNNLEMGYIFEELIRKFSELSNETAGEHFTPREVIRLMVNLLFLNDDKILTGDGITKTLYDPACGTGGMLSIAQEYLQDLNPGARLESFGQEVNPESFAICKSDMLIKGQNSSNIKFGNTFTIDGLPNDKFDYMLTNPPFGVEWKKIESIIKTEYEAQGFGGRFGAGLPRITDGQLLFLQHMISKMKRSDGGSRIGIVFNGSPLFTGSAGSGESEIRKWIIENDMLEAIVALPDQLFYNTGISTYIWIVTNRKPPERKGRIHFVNAVSFYNKMRKSLGNKRNEISEEQINTIVRIYGDYTENEYCKIFPNDHFGYNRITVERPLRLNFQVSEERIESLNQESAFKNLINPKKKGQAGEDERQKGEKLQQGIRNTLINMDSSPLYKNRDEFTNVLESALKKAGIKLPSSIFKAVLKALSQRDETADPCLDMEGNPEPDPELRDYENVPLKDDIGDYFEREVKPHVQDAWIDYDKTRTGYEINFTREFYQYKPLRPLGEIEAELISIQSEISELFKEVMN